MKPSSKRNATIRVKKSRPYTTKTEKVVKRKAHNRKVNKYPDTYLAYRNINGEQRLCRIIRKGNNEYIRVIDDKRKAKPITLKEATERFHKLPESSQNADKKYKAKNTFTRENINTKYLSSPNRYDVEELDTPPKKDLNKEDKITRLEGLGGNRWQKHEKDRIYFNAGDLAILLGYKWENYNTGNISSAKLDGERISNSEMKRVLNDLNCKLYYDVKDEKFNYYTGIGTGKDHTEDAIKFLKKEI